MTKQLNPNAEELQALMDDLDSMIAAEESKEVAEVSAVETETVQEILTEAAIVHEDADEPPAAILAPVTPPPSPAPVATPATTPVPILQHYVDVNEFKETIAIGETNLDAAMMQQAGMRAYYGSVAAQAEAQAARLKAKFEILEAKLYHEHETLLVAQGKKATVTQIEASIKADPRWYAGKKAVIDAEAIANVNKGLTFALADRRDMLIQLGSDRRQEQQGQLRINALTDLTNRARAAAQPRE